MEEKCKDCMHCVDFQLPHNYNDARIWWRRRRNGWNKWVGAMQRFQVIYVLKSKDEIEKSNNYNM